ncbi:MAG TPA: ATP-binding protein [Bacillota bacterium]|nr:ATP-binding protein [Bacillota bacterium]
MRIYQDDLFTTADLARLADLAPTLPDLTGSAWRDAIIDRIVYADNPWSRDAEARGGDACRGWLAEAARADLRDLQALSASSPQGSGPAWGAGEPAAAAMALAGASDWGDCLPQLAEHHHRQGCGDLSRYAAFRWQGRRLRPVADPDLVRPEDIVGHVEARAALASNTERFLRGLPAHDVLLFGGRGTGKSSSVKALLTRYRDRGLRLVEAGREVVGDFSDLAAAVRGRRQRFILFLDDLSFEAEETEYKALKAALEGGVEARPGNLLVYATSNRRHLVREAFAEREDLHGQDTLEEKVSLADRFGLTVRFATPDEEGYLAIVAALCRARGIDPDASRLRERALQWAAWGSGRSGRSARQLVDVLVAEAAEARR